MTAQKKKTKGTGRGSAGKEYPPDVLRQLASSLSGDGDLPRGILVRGDEPYFRFAAVDLLRAAARRRGAESREPVGVRLLNGPRLPMIPEMTP